MILLQRLSVLACVSTLALSLGACDDKKTPPATKNNAKASNAEKKKTDEAMAGSKTGGVFTMAIAADPETYDPAKMSGAPEGRIAFNIFEGLLMPGPTTEGLKDNKQLVVPGVAKSLPEVSDDGLTYTFKLREDAKWSNGDPLTSQDFVYSWRRVLDPNTGADYATMLHVIDGAKAFNTYKPAKDAKPEDTAKAMDELWSKVGISAPDDKTLVVKLTTPTPYFMENLAFYTFFPVPKKVVEAKGKDWTKPENIVTNGAYKLAKYTPQQDIVLEKSPTYWDAENVALDKARLRIIPDRNAVVNAYKTGELHWSGQSMPVAQITQLLTFPDYMSEPMLGTYYFRVNVSDKASPLSDAKVRQALSMAIDRDSIVDQTLNGLYKVAGGMVPDSIAGFKSTAKTAYNPKKARKLLEEAGFTKDKPMPKIELLYNTDENHKLVAEAVQAMLKRNLGLDVTLANKEWKSYLQDVDTLKYQIARAGWIGDYNDPMTFLEMWVTGDGNNDTGWSNAEYDKLIADSRQETDPAKRTAILQKAEQLLVEQGPVIPIYFLANNTLISKGIEGFAPHNRDVHLLKYMKFKSDK